MNRLEEYFLGVIWGDGSLDRGVRVKISCHSEEVGWHNILFSLVREAFEVRPTLSVHLDCKETDIYINSTRVCQMYVPYKEKGHWILPIKLNYPEEVLAGLFDTDGCFSLIKRKSGRIGDWARIGSFGSAKYKNILIAQKLLKDLGWGSKIRETEGNSFGKICKLFVINIQSLKGFLFLREKISIRHPQKCQKLNEIIASYKRDWGYNRLLVGEV